VLERAGLVHRTVVGREHRCRLRPVPRHCAADRLAGCERYWSERLDALVTLVTAPEEPS
jgi:hypothetical protein